MPAPDDWSASSPESNPFHIFPTQRVGQFCLTADSTILKVACIDSLEFFPPSCQLPWDLSRPAQQRMDRQHEEEGFPAESIGQAKLRASLSDRLLPLASDHEAMPGYDKALRALWPSA